jgi:ferredoxin
MKKAQIIDLDGCMECGGCATNCPTEAITVTPGVGCAAYIIQKWLKGTKLESITRGCC